MQRVTSDGENAQFFDGGSLVAEVNRTELESVVCVRCGDDASAIGEDFVIFVLPTSLVIAPLDIEGLGEVLNSWEVWLNDHRLVHQGMCGDVPAPWRRRILGVPWGGVRLGPQAKTTLNEAQEIEGGLAVEKEPRDLAKVEWNT